MCLGVLSMCVSTHHLRAHYPEARRGHQIPWGLSYSSEWVLGIEQLMLLAAQPSLQPLEMQYFFFLFFIRFIYLCI